MKEEIISYLERKGEQVTLVGPMAKSFEAPANQALLFVDGGAKLKSNEGYSLGDNDSFSGKLDLVLPKEKDFSDLSYALSLIPSKTKSLSLKGFLGGRKDHELINLGEVYRFLCLREDTQLILDQSILSYSKGEWDLEIEGEFSLLSYDQQIISMVGSCQYPLENTRIEPHSSHGLSNNGSGKITLSNERPVFIFLN